MKNYPLGRRDNDDGFIETKIYRYERIGLLKTINL